MTNTPASELSLPVSYLRETLAESATFQALVGVLNATDAKAFIHYYSTTSTTPPFAVVGRGDSTRWSTSAGGTRNHFHEVSGDLVMLIRGTVSSETDANAGDEAIGWDNTIGDILTDMQLLAGTGGKLDIRDFDAGPPMRPEIEQAKSEGDFIETLVRIEYGSKGA